MYSDSLVYKLVVVTCERPFSSQELWVSTCYLPSCTQHPENHPICGSMHLLPSTLLPWWLAMIPGWEGHVLQTDANHLIHLQREVDEVWLLL